MSKNYFRYNVIVLLLVCLFVNPIRISAATKKIPVSAGAYKYSPKSWNKVDYTDIYGNEHGDILSATNCYVYALNIRKNPIYNKKYSEENGVIGSNPGDFSNNRKPLTEVGINIKNVTVRFSDDMKKIGYKIKTIKVKNKYKKIKNKNTHLVYLVTTKKDKTYRIIDRINHIVYYFVADYHWYRQDKSGYWSHKRGHTKVINVDSKGKKILDPSLCKRYYVEYQKFNYIIDGEKYKVCNVCDYSGDGKMFSIKK